MNLDFDYPGFLYTNRLCIPGEESPPYHSLQIKTPCRCEFVKVKEHGYPQGKPLPRLVTTIDWSELGLPLISVVSIFWMRSGQITDYLLGSSFPGLDIQVDRLSRILTYLYLFVDQRIIPVEKPIRYEALPVLKLKNNCVK